MPLPKPGNSLFSNSFFIFITRFFPSLANLLVMIWYSHHLPADMYGSYQHFWIQLLVFYPLVCFGIHVLIITYSPGAVLHLAKKIQAKQYTLYALWGLALAGIFTVMQCYALHIQFWIPFFFLLCYSLSFILESVLIVFRNFRSLVVINVLYSAAFCAIHWYMLQHEFSLDVLFAYLLIITVLKFLIYALVVKADIGNVAPMEDASYDATKVRSLWLHLGLYDVVQLLSGYLDKFIISIVLTAGLSAIYYNGSQNIPFLPLLLSAAGSAVLIQLAGSDKGDEPANMVRLMKQSGRVLSCIVFPVFFFLLFFRYEVIGVLFSDKYIAAVPIFLASILVLPVRAYSFTTILQKLHKGNIINTGAVCELLLACLLMYPLYKWLGLPGVALSFVITTYLQALYYLYHTAKLLNTGLWKLVPYADWAIKLIVFAIVFITIHYACHQYFTGKISLILGGGVMITLIVVSLLLELNKQKKHVHP